MKRTVLLLEGGPMHGARVGWEGDPPTLYKPTICRNGVTSNLYYRKTIMTDAANRKLYAFVVEEEVREK